MDIHLKFNLHDFDNPTTRKSNKTMYHFFIMQFYYVLKEDSLVCRTMDRITWDAALRAY